MSTALSTPNLFAYATSELSQDAVLAYLLAWADVAYADEPRHDLARELIQVLAKAAVDTRTKRTANAEPKLATLIDLPAYTHVDVRRQYGKIDVIAFLDPVYEDKERSGQITSAAAAILIEDKTFTGIHSGQLGRYLSELDLGKAGGPVYPIVYKTGLQSDYSAEEGAGFAAYTRRQMGELLDAHPKALDKDLILRQYRDYLASLNDAYARGRTRVPGDHVLNPHLAWQGFMDEVATRLREEKTVSFIKWDYVANAQGGFVGMWWAFTPFTAPAPDVSGRAVTAADGVQVYLQLEQDVLTIRMGTWNNDDTTSYMKISRELRWAVHNALSKKLAAPFEELGYRLHTSGSSGGWSARLFRVLPVGEAGKGAVTFVGETEIDDVATSLTKLTQAFSTQP